MSTTPIRNQNQRSSKMKTSFKELKQLPLQEVLALMPSWDRLPDNFYGVDGRQKRLPEDVSQRVWNIADASDFLPSDLESLEVLLMLMCLTGQLYLSGIAGAHRQGRFVYSVHN